eukprot:3848644-Rhodomonas_salina.1
MAFSGRIGMATLAILLAMISPSRGVNPSVACTKGFDPKPRALNVTTLVIGDPSNLIYDVSEDPSQENIVFIAGNMLKLASRAHQNTSILAGSSQAGDVDGVGTDARFDLPNGGLAFTPDGATVVVADTRNNKIKLITLSNGQ